MKSFLLVILVVSGMALEALAARKHYAPAPPVRRLSHDNMRGMEDTSYPSTPLLNSSIPPALASTRTDLPSNSLRDRIPLPPQRSPRSAETSQQPARSATPPTPASPQESVEPLSRSWQEPSTLHYRYPAQAPHAPSNHRRTAVISRRPPPLPPQSSRQFRSSTQDSSDTRSIRTLPLYSEEEAFTEILESNSEGLQTDLSTEVRPPSYEQSCLASNQDLINLLLENLPGESTPRQEALLSQLMNSIQAGNSYEEVQNLLAELLEETSSATPSASTSRSISNPPQYTLTEASLVTILLDTIRDYSTAVHAVRQEQTRVQQDLTRLECGMETLQFHVHRMRNQIDSDQVAQSEDLPELDSLFYDAFHSQFQSIIQTYLQQSTGKAGRNRNSKMDNFRKTIKTSIPFLGNLLNSACKAYADASHEDRAANVAEAFQGYTDQISPLSRTLALQLTDSFRPIFHELAGGTETFTSLARELESLAHRDVNSGNMLDPILRIEERGGSQIEKAREIGRVLASRVISKLKTRDSKKSSVNQALTKKYPLRNGESLTAGQLLIRAQQNTQ